MTRRFKLWGILVLFNALSGFFWSGSLYFDEKPLELISVVLGVITFVFIYAEVDFRLGLRGLTVLRKRMVTGAIVRGILQAGLYSDIFFGVISISVVSQMFDEVPFVTVYLTVLVHGLLLSVFVGLLMAIIHCAIYLWQRFKRDPISA